MADDARYFAFLLRLWNEKKAGEDAWRASLEDPHTGEQKGFANLEAVFAYLDHKTKSRHQEECKKETDS